MSWAPCLLKHPEIRLVLHQYCKCVVSLQHALPAHACASTRCFLMLKACGCRQELGNPTKVLLCSTCLDPQCRMLKMSASCAHFADFTLQHLHHQPLACCSALEEHAAADVVLLRSDPSCLSARPPTPQTGGLNIGVPTPSGPLAGSPLPGTSPPAPLSWQPCCQWMLHTHLWSPSE